MSETISSAEAELDDIQAGIPDDSIISEAATPTTIAPVITLGTIIETGLPVSSQNQIRQHADISSREQQSSRQKNLSSSIKISDAATVTTTDSGGDSVQSTYEHETISFQISIPISIQT